MKRKELEEIVAGEADKLGRYAGRILSADDAEDIHQFRVTYKKLRAFLRLVHPGKSKSLLKQVKPVYTASGEVRDRQIQLYIIKNWLEQDGCREAIYPGILDNEIKERKRHLYEVINSISFQHLTGNLADGLPERLDDEVITMFVHKQAEGFSNNIKEDANDEQLHTARKHLKDIIYNAEYLRADKTDSLFADNHKEIKSLATLLGDYHDKQVLINSLVLAPAGKIFTEEKESLLRLQEKLNGDKMVLKTGIRDAAKKLLDIAGKSNLSIAVQAGLLVSSAMAAGLGVFFLIYMGKKDM